MLRSKSRSMMSIRLRSSKPTIDTQKEELSPVWVVAPLFNGIGVNRAESWRYLVSLHYGLTLLRVLF